jgi:trans-aconitate 2-methyltransferase
VVSTPWDARTYDQTNEPQRAWASEVLRRLEGLPQDAVVLDVGCGTGRVTEALAALVPRGRVLAMDASPDMVALARARLGDCAEVWCQDVPELAPLDYVRLNVSAVRAPKCVRSGMDPPTRSEA